MFKVINTSILGDYGFIHYNAGCGTYGEYWIKPINAEEYFLMEPDSSQAYIRVKYDGTVQISYECEQTVNNGDGEDYGGEIRVPLDELWELIEAGVVKKIRKKGKK